MKCPLCSSPLDEVPKPRLLSRVVALIQGEGIDQAVKFRCPKCRTAVSTCPVQLFLHGETIEDFRKSCVTCLAGLHNRKILLGGFWTTEEQSLVDQYERFVRILDAMTPEEREGTEPPGPAQREHLATASGSTPDEVEQAFNEFSMHVEILRQARTAKFPWHALIPSAIFFPFLLAPMFIERTDDAAAVVSGFGYALICVLLLFVCLTRLKNANRLVYSTWLRYSVFVFVIPGALGAAAVLLIHEHVVRAGWEQIPVTLGFITIGLIFAGIYCQISFKMMMRRILREQRNAQPAAPVPSEPSQGL